MLLMIALVIWILAVYMEQVKKFLSLLFYQ